LIGTSRDDALAKHLHFVAVRTVEYRREPEQGRYPSFDARIEFLPVALDDCFQSLPLIVSSQVI
jgi:hypothetical protein